MAKKIHVKTGDTVVLLSGDYKDKWTVSEDKEGNVKKKVRKTGKVIAVSPEEGKVIVEGINVISKHKKPRKQGEAGGIIKTEGAIYACKVQLYCSKCDKGVRTHTKIVDGKKVRVCAKCGTEI